MRTGLIVSGTAHAVLIAWGFVSLTSSPLDASKIEQIPVDFVTLADDTQLTKGLQTANLVEETPSLPAPEKPKEEPPPLPKPEPPKVEPTPAPTPPPPPPPPPPTAEESPPPLPMPDAETPPPPDETAAAPLKDVPMPRIRPKVPPQKQPDASDMDAIQALLDKRKLDEMAAAEPPADQPPTVGAPDAATNVKMTASELEVLRSRLARCWNVPIGWTDPAEVRVVLMLSLNPDGTVNGRPQVLESPQGQYSNAAPESAIRAVLLCAPYNLPAAKYDAWKQVKVTFDPRDMGAT